MNGLKKTATCCIAMILGLQGTGLQALANTPLSSIDDGLVAYVNMDDNVLETKRNKELAFKGDGNVTYEQGIKGKAMRFSSEATGASRLEFENREDLKFKEGEPYTVGLWLKANEPKGDYSIIGTKDWNSGKNFGYILSMQDDPKFMFSTISKKNDEPIDNRFDKKSSEYAFDNSWVYLSVSQKVDGTSTLYVNGIKATIEDSSGADGVNSPAGNLSIGGDFAGHNGFKNEAALDEVKVWNRTLSEAEIRSEYTGTASVEIQGANQVDLGDGEDKELTYSLESFGGIDDSAEWAITESAGVSIEKIDAKQAKVIIEKDVDINQVEINATYHGVKLVKNINILKDMVITSANLSGTNIVVVNGEDTGVGYDVTFHNQNGTVITIDHPDDIVWELKDAPTGVTITKNGAHADVHIAKTVEDQKTFRVTVTYQGISQEISTNVVHRGTIPSEIMDKVETYLDFDGDLQDQKGKVIPNTGEITFGEGQINQGANFTKGHFLDLGNQNLENKSIAFSIKSNHFTGTQDPAIIGNKDWNSGDDNGFIFAYSWDEMKNRITGGSGNKLDHMLSYADKTWKNIVLVFASDEKTYKIYADGMLLGENNTSSFAQDWQNGGTNHTTLKIGNDGTGSYGENAKPESEYEFTMDNFMIVDDVLSAEEVAMLDATYQGDKTIHVEAIGSKSIPSGSFYNLNLHLNGSNLKDVKEVMFDIEYDKDCLEIQPDASQMSVADTWLDTSPEDNRIRIRHMPVARQISNADFITYQQTRIVKLDFLAKNISEKKDTKIKITNIRLFKERNEVQEIEDITSAGNEFTLSIQPKTAYDFNGDGVVGAGDVSLAPVDQKEATADVAAIYPYKRVVMVTVDGAGNVWDPENAHYDSTSGKLGLENARTNDFAMKLHNEEFASSYTAQAVMPAISAHNYSSMFTGVKWLDRPEEYQATNESGGIHYWPDYGKETALYPTIFKTINDQAPNRLTTAVPEWDVIMDGLIEPDTGNYSFSTYNKTTFEMAAEYMKANPEKFKQNAFMYLQSDELDHYGHASGYFTDGYYELLKSYDDQFKSLVDALKEQDAYEDTMIISNSDHGGQTEYDEDGNIDGGGHGVDHPFDRTIYMSFGGQTINSGKRLEGGSNEDIPALVLAGLRMDKPAGMSDSDVFDTSMFLDQEQMIQKNRDIEKITWNYETNSSQATVLLENPKSEIRTVDMVIQNKGNEIKSIKTDGEILRQDIKEDGTYITLAFQSTPEVVAEVNFAKAINEDTKIHEVMLGSNQGKEIYCDLETKTKDTIQTYHVSYELENVDVTNKVNEVKENESFSATVVANKGYDLPKTISLLMDGVQVQSGVTYDVKTGKITVEKVTGNLVVQVKGVKQAETPRPEEYPEIKVEDETGVSVQGKLPEGVKLVVDDKTSNEIDTIQTAIKDKDFKDKYTLEQVLDIELYLNGAPYTLEHGVEVKIKLTDALKAKKNVKVVYINDQNEVSFVESSIQGDEIIFRTDHFSRYAIVSEKEEVVKPGEIVKPDEEVKPDPGLPKPELPGILPEDQKPGQVKPPFTKEPTLYTNNTTGANTGDTSNTSNAPAFLGLLMGASMMLYGVQKKKKSEVK